MPAKHAKCVRPCRGARFEVAQIVRAHSAQLQQQQGLSREQQQVWRALSHCRTAALGGHLQVCRQCGHERPRYNSCRNRHCPKCQALAQYRWLKARVARILPVHHFHVVFTLPAELRPLVMFNRRLLYGLLLSAAPHTLLTLGQDSKRLGAQLGISAVLHTWTRDLSFHPHVHCVVTGGGLAADGQTWVSTRPGYLFPVRVLGALFRGKFLDGLSRLHETGKLHLPPSLRSASDFRECLARLRAKRWLVYCKPPFGSAEAVYAYLGRYTHRIGVSDRRLLDVTEHEVRLRTREGKSACMTGVEFLRRFIQHVLPKGFVRIRHFGLLAASNATTKLETARQLLEARTQPGAAARAVHEKKSAESAGHYVALYLELTGVDLHCCPVCGADALAQRPLPAWPRAPPS